MKAFKQRQREVKLAVELVNKLQLYIDIINNGQNSDSFKEQIRSEVMELASTPFGGTLVTTIGMSSLYIYMYVYT